MHTLFVYADTATISRANEWHNGSGISNRLSNKAARFESFSNVQIDSYPCLQTVSFRESGLAIALRHYSGQNNPARATESAVNGLT